MDNLLGSKPFMMPTSTISSTGKRSGSSSECSISSMDSCLEDDPLNIKPTSSKLIAFCVLFIES